MFSEVSLNYFHLYIELTFLVLIYAFFYVQVDLFFYREPEEAKQAEEEELIAPIEYGSAAPDYTMNLVSEQWPAQISDAKWSGEGQKPIAAVPDTYFPDG